MSCTINQDIIRERRIAMWEKIFEESVSGGGIETNRMKVPGGWIVATTMIHHVMNGAGCSVHQLFISDPEHKWTIEKR